jgi:hypothetical protein
MTQERVVARKERLLDETAVAELRYFSIIWTALEVSCPYGTRF